MRRRFLLPLGLLILALLLRLPGLDRWPPPLHQDEASNVVDAWSLLTDGVDRAGRAWPVFLQGFGDGDNRTSLYAMLAIPGVAVFGPGAFSARLPAALWGAWTVLALFLFVRKIRGTGVGVCAALLLAFNPWHLYLSRFGHEASLTPGFIVTALWLVAEGIRKEEGSIVAPGTGGPSQETDARKAQVRSWISWALAGLVLAGGLYSYPSFRLFLPLFALLVLLTRAGPKLDRKALILVATLLAGSLPLLITGFNHPLWLLGRASVASVIGNVEPLGAALLLVARQYVAHFSPLFLFVRGDGNPLHSPPGGQLLWAELPGLVVGIVMLIRRRDRWDRLFLVWLFLYPVASALALGDEPGYVPHSLRAAVGLPVFQILGGEGFAAIIERLTSARRAAIRRIAWLYAASVVVNFAIVAAVFAGNYGRSVAPLYHSLYPGAMKYLATSRNSYDAVLISCFENRQAYIYAILFGPISPREYRTGQKEVDNSGAFHLVHRVGNLYFVQSEEDARGFDPEFRGRLWLVAPVSPTTGGRLLATFSYPDGRPGLEIREFVIPGQTGS